MKKLLLLALAAACLLAGCARGGAPDQAGSQELYEQYRTPLETLLDSVVYNDRTGELRFVIPETIPPEQKLNLLVSGTRYTEGNARMSWHAFQEESASYSWEPGSAYATTVGPEDLEEIILYASLLAREGVGEYEKCMVAIDAKGNMTRLE